MKINLFEWKIEAIKIFDLKIHMCWRCYRLSQLWIDLSWCVVQVKTTKAHAFFRLKCIIRSTNKKDFRWHIVYYTQILLLERILFNTLFFLKPYISWPMNYYTISMVYSKNKKKNHWYFLLKFIVDVGLFVLACFSLIFMWIFYFLSEWFG